MTVSNEKPKEYYKQIDCPYEKKDEIRTIFKMYDIIEHTNAEEDYDHLYDNDIVLEIVNPYREENLFITFEGEFTLSFGYWHAHYFPYEYDYNIMIADAAAIVNGKYGVMSFWFGDKWSCDVLLKEEITHFTAVDELIAKANFDVERMKKVKEQGVDIIIEYWEPNDCFEFNVSPESQRGEYYFPRRYGVRFVMKEGIPYGSGGWKRYDDETAYMHYVWIDEGVLAEPERRRLELVLIKILEEDIRCAGLSKVFVNIEDSDTAKYASLGYVAVDKIANDKVWALTGCGIIFDKTMMKVL